MSVPVNDRVRVEPGRDGEIVVMAAWCGKCKGEVMPVGDGDCPWCGSRILDESQLSARAMLGQLRAVRSSDEPGSPEPGPVEPAPSPEGEPDPVGGGARRARGQLQAEVLRELVAGNESAASIAAALAMPATQISATLTTLVKKGLAEKVRFGIYTSTEAGREALASGAKLDARHSGRAARLAPAAREGNTAARPAESEREPEATDPAEAEVAPSRRALLAAEGATSRSDVLLRAVALAARAFADAILEETA